VIWPRWFPVAWAFTIGYQLGMTGFRFPTWLLLGVAALLVVAVGGLYAWDRWSR